MAVCASCGHEAAAEFRFCPECGAPVERAVSDGVRKTVSVVFCDLVGSTALGESMDPEAVQALLRRYFARMRVVVERHGGTVEKFIGDAVVAVFGVPVVHEDDALRACRAAAEMRDALPELGLRGRLGVNTGEVMTGADDVLAAGDTMNVAARLEQAAPPGEVLIGQETHAAARNTVEVERIESLTLKGKAEPVPAYRLLSVLAVPERSHDLPFVGREEQLQRILAAWQRATAEGRCELVTLIGDAGVGKSRLVAEAVARIPGRVVRGRCLPYGEGITYWPVVEVLKQLATLPTDPAAAAAISSLLGTSDAGSSSDEIAVEVLKQLATLPTDPAAAAAISSLLGTSDAGSSSDEIAWAFRKLLEEHAPLLVVFDDLQWGEETFLDLVESTALLASGGPLLLVCMARPELLQRRPAWPDAVTLEPLAREQADTLIGSEVAPELRERIAEAAGGNPLFISEMLAMAAEQVEVEVPGTLKTLLAMRLDQLEEAERRVLERGSVEGEIFHRGAVQALAPEETHVDLRLAALVRHQVVRPDRPQLSGEDGYRFRHLLLRDAAYDALPKATRADLHRRFANWLETRDPDLVELDEIVGYHLEQAVRYLDELGRPDPHTALAAGDRLAAGGERAFWLGDWRAAVALLERALSLTRGYRFDLRREIALADALYWIDAARAVVIAEAAAERAAQGDDEAEAALARIVAAEARFQTGECSTDELERSAKEALPLLEAAEDDDALVHVWQAFAWAANMRSRYEDWARAAETARLHALRAGHPVPGMLTLMLAVALAHGPRPASEALAALDSVLGDNPYPGAVLVRGLLLAMLDRIDEAWAVALPAEERCREIGFSASGEWLGEIALVAGDYRAAAAHLGDACEALEAAGNPSELSTYAPLCGLALCELGEYDDAERLAQRGRALGDPDDVETQRLWRQTQSLVLAARGRSAEAERLAREAVDFSLRSDSTARHGDALVTLAKVLQGAGRVQEAADALRRALALYEQKGVLPLARRIRERLDAMQPAQA